MSKELEESPLKPVIDSLRKRALTPKRKILIFADSREFASDVIEELEKYDCLVKQKMLIVGDYLVSDRVCIERKSAEDFVNSIMDKRLFSQLSALKDNFEKPVLLIEGNNLYGRLNPNAVRGALATIALDFNIPLIWTRNAEESAGIIYWIARREQIEEKREVALRGDRKTESMDEKQEYLISGLPGVSIVRARALLKKFRKPREIFSAKEEELAKVEGLGPKTAKKIKEILDREYKSK